MAIFKKVIKRKKNIKPQDDECWYNNEHEKIRKLPLVPVVDETALSSPNGVYYTSAKSNTSKSR